MITNYWWAQISMARSLVHVGAQHWWEPDSGGLSIHPKKEQGGREHYFMEISLEICRQSGKIKLKILEIPGIVKFPPLFFLWGCPHWTLYLHLFPKTVVCGMLLDLQTGFDDFNFF